MVPGLVKNCLFDRITILGKVDDKTARKLLEAFDIGKEGATMRQSNFGLLTWQ